MIKEWDILTSVMNSKPKMFYLTWYDVIKFYGVREATAKKLNTMYCNAEISSDTYHRLRESIRGL